MPEHVHLLLSEPQRDVYGDHNAPLKPKDGLNGPPVSLIGRPGSHAKERTLADALKSLKQGVSRRLIGDARVVGQFGSRVRPGQREIHRPAGENAGLRDDGVVGEMKLHHNRCAAFLAKAVLRFQCSGLRAVCGKAALHSSQSGEGWVVRASGGLAVEAVFVTTPLAARDELRLNRNGRRESANERREDCVRLWNSA
jgi:hypothetical protein